MKKKPQDKNSVYVMNDKNARVPRFVLHHGLGRSSSVKSPLVPVRDLLKAQNDIRTKDK